MKRTALIFGVLFIAISILVIIQINFSYPKEWRKIKLSDTRESVIDYIGHSIDSTLSDVKGEFWIYENRITEYQLLVCYNPNGQVNHKRVIAWLKLNPDYLSWKIVDDYQTNKKSG